MYKELPQTRKWVSANFLATYFEVTPKTIWFWAKEKKLPEPHKIGPNVTRWDFEEILSWEPAKSKSKSA